MSNRILSVDVLRGMTIFFMIIVNNPGSWSHVYSPLLHAKWHGCTPTDLVFPFFLFIVGVSMAFSFRKYEEVDRVQWITKILKRTVLIFLVGIFLNWFPFFHKNINDLRIFGVLQRIALAYGGAGMIIVFCRNKYTLGIITTIILFAYWAMLFYHGSDNPYSLEGNLASIFDPSLIGENHVYKGFGIPFDPEGLVSSLPGIAHVIIGFLIGLQVLQHSINKKFLLKILGASGIILIIGGQIWNLGFPINKPLWTSSYVLYTTGFATLFLAILIWIIDIKKWTAWSFPFRVFGLNPLASFVLSGIFVKICMYILPTNIYGWLYSNIFTHVVSPKFGSLLQAALFCGFVWFFAYSLYKKGKVIKL